MKGIFQKAPYNRFEEFISPGAGRFTLLCSVLEASALPYRTVNVAGNRHIFVQPAANLGNTVLTAHYDRTGGSPGANDNSAAVFMLIEAALGMRAAARPGPLFIFTDKEELSNGEGLKEQGAYSLALYLKDKGLANPRIYCFDACGSGDTLVISTAADHLLRDEIKLGAAVVRRRVQELRSAALEAAREARLEKVLLLPTPFSDDGGFLRAGLPAQTVTVLPALEAAAFASLVRTRPEAAAALVSSSASMPDKLIPETWRSLNGPGDSLLRLTPEHWKRVTAFAAALGGV
ncbi:MAG: M28 family peptidase [Treponema sp.]|jgi:hypothetical protein|nr:M28 family peptidase [Treponema sp.]